MCAVIVQVKNELGPIWKCLKDFFAGRAFMETGLQSLAESSQMLSAVFTSQIERLLRQDLATVGLVVIGQTWISQAHEAAFLKSRDTRADVRIVPSQNTALANVASGEHTVHAGELEVTHPYEPTEWVRDQAWSLMPEE
jgi:hypothetical protein